MPAEQNRPDVARRREQWKAWQGQIAPGRLIFIDDTWANTNMTRTHGRRLRGKRLVAKVPHGHRRTLIFVAGLRCDLIVVPCLAGRPIDRESFLAGVTQFPVPTLRTGDIVVMVNPSSHKDPAIRRAIRSAGANCSI